MRIIKKDMKIEYDENSLYETSFERKRNSKDC